MVYEKNWIAIVSIPYGVIIYSVVLFVNLLIKNYGEIVPYEFRF